MPTGYTAAVQEGKATPKEFLTHIAQAFGIGGDRDYDENAEVERMQAHLVRYQYDLNDLLALTPAQAEARAQQAYAEAVQRWADLRVSQAKYRSNYESALRVVQAWEVPKEIQPIKKYAIEQLVQSIQHDCEGYEFAVPVLQEGGEWLADRLTFARRMVKTYEEEVRKAEQARIERSTRRRKFAEALQGV